MKRPSYLTGKTLPLCIAVQCALISVCVLKLFNTISIVCRYWQATFQTSLQSVHGTKHGSFQLS